MYNIRPTTKFQKDLKRVKKRGFDIPLLTDIIKKLAAGEPLPEKNRDHQLSGDYAGCRECHITPDWLLIYEVDGDELILYLTRTGSHSDLFKGKEERSMSWDKERIAQLQLPDLADDDPHPRLLLEGDGIHAGQGFTALFPDGWHEITLEVAWEPTGPGCWYISTPGFEGVCPVGLFVKV